MANISSGCNCNVKNQGCTNAASTSQLKFDSCYTNIHCASAHILGFSSRCPNCASAATYHVLNPFLGITVNRYEENCEPSLKQRVGKQVTASKTSDQIFGTWQLMNMHRTYERQHNKLAEKPCNPRIRQITFQTFRH